jgi:hypothetical protein
LPPEAQSIATCITQRTSRIGSCAEGVALNAAQAQTFSVVEKLKADARSELEAAQPGAIRNLIGIVEGVQTDNWLQVSRYAGPELYKVVVKALVYALCPELIPAKPAVDPAIDAIIQARVDLVVGVVDAARERNASRVVEVLTAAYLAEGLVVPCTLIPDGDVREAVCGTLGTIIRGVAHGAGSVVETVINVIKDALDLAADLWDGLLKSLGLTHSDCLPPEQRYAAYYGICYNRGVTQRIAGTAQLNALTASLNDRCRRDYDRCFTSSHFDELCNPQQNLFRAHTERLHTAVQRAAKIYARNFDVFARDHGNAACDPEAFKQKEYQQFLDRCAISLAGQIPLAGDPRLEACYNGGSQVAPELARSAHRTACANAITAATYTSVLAKACPLVTPEAPTGCHTESDGRCGFVTVHCDAPLPNATKYGVAGDCGCLTVQETHAPQFGEVSAQYTGEPGAMTARVCAINVVGAKTHTACSNSFKVRLNDSQDHTCFSSHHQDCPSDKKRCGFDHGKPICIDRNAPCDKEGVHGPQ